ncbi:uncharacterized protein ColSpa_08409 [Colletotrichum spaethianum]|uniref:FAM192A/Fyv6 N-terminal domain-containing protein n=1 Tax=Colletotrichum spaethianum TaxID=700344 RepID=A0AA37URK1_9PEZI|nr:uncharacterized protein ColSpa_08409 [Colletotrichum spaethianum]GKT48228.1 hypothetical protein ColSpa_08409 [Colletotrichum spaethianum]
MSRFVSAGAINAETGEAVAAEEAKKGDDATAAAAFEEANKIRNQFRALDDDEIDFLDDVRESKRAEEERVRRETEEGLAAFRRAQNQKRPVDDDGDGAAAAGGAGTLQRERAGDGAGAEEEWTVGPRKRRKRERGFGVKREKSGEGAPGEGAKKTEEKGVEKAAAATTRQGGEQEEAAKGSPPAPVKGKLSLVAYGSDSDDD